jgi:hypothetical protein
MSQELERAMDDLIKALNDTQNHIQMMIQMVEEDRIPPSGGRPLKGDELDGIKNFDEES